MKRCVSRDEGCVGSAGAVALWVEAIGETVVVVAAWRRVSLFAAERV